MKDENIIAIQHVRYGTEKKGTLPERKKEGGGRKDIKETNRDM